MAFKLGGMAEFQIERKGKPVSGERSQPLYNRFTLSDLDKPMYTHYPC